MSQKTHWIKNIVPTLGLLVGIIMTSIGGYVILARSGQLALFSSSSYFSVNEEACMYQGISYLPPVNERKDLVRLSKKEKAHCIAKQELKEITRFQKDKKQDLVDGVAAFIVGFGLILAFKRREK